MIVTGNMFLMFMLPITVGAYYLLCRQARAKMLFLMVLSLLLYSLAGVRFLSLLCLLSFVTYWSARRGWFAIGVALNLAALATFKYWDFGALYLSSLMGVMGSEFAVRLMRLALPLGISFYVFKHIGYLLSVRQQRYEAGSDFLAFLTFSAYFPQIGAGPISDFRETSDQFQVLPGRLSGDQLYAGLVHLGLGLAKKVLIADVLGNWLARLADAPDPIAGLLPAWLMILAYALQLYFDFSGYTDIVLGISMFFGVRLPPNFSSPYLATNPAEFWERWHMSLSMWFRQFLFFPLSRVLLRALGANRRDQAQFIATMVTMILIGIWHGAAWNFVAWGAFHGLLLSLHAWWRRSGRALPAVPGRILLIFSVLLGWALFMSPDVTHLRHFFSQLFGFDGLHPAMALDLLFQGDALPALVLGLILSVSGAAEASNFLKLGGSRRGWQALAWGILTAVCLLLKESSRQFLYIQF